MSAVAELMRLDPCKSIVPLGDGTETEFRHSDLDFFESQPTGISCQEIEFLYGLVRLVRPVSVIETGCNVGVSASAICLALRDNKRGHLTTIEHDGTVAAIAEKKLSAMGFTNFGIFKGKVSEHQHILEVIGDTNAKVPSIDFLFLDSELAQRYAELLFYFPYMHPGAVACIHDLSNLDMPEYGGIPDSLSQLIQTGELRALTFNTNHGITVFQKRRSTDALADLSKQ